MGLSSRSLGTKRFEVRVRMGPLSALAVVVVVADGMVVSAALILFLSQRGGAVTEMTLARTGVLD